MEKTLYELMKDESSLNVRGSKIENVAGSLARAVHNQFGTEQEIYRMKLIGTLTVLAYASLC